MRDRPEVYHERIRQQIREEVTAQVRYEFAQELIRALKPTLARDVTMQRVIELVESMQQG